MSVTDCIFCTRRDQPPILFGIQFLYIMPDKFPFLPGHTLVISKQHRTCLGDTSIDELRELDQVAARLRAFPDATYGGPTWVMANGISGPRRLAPGSAGSAEVRRWPAS